MAMLALAAVLTFTTFGLLGAWLGKASGRPQAGFIWGFIVGPVGWLLPVAWLLAASRRRARALSSAAS